MKEFFILLAYNDHYTENVVGIYSTLKKALKKQQNPDSPYLYEDGYSIFKGRINRPRPEWKLVSEED